MKLTKQYKVDQFSHILAVPVRSNTVNPGLMESLARGMQGWPSLSMSSIHVMALPEEVEETVTQTATILARQLSALGAAVTTSVRSFILPEVQPEDNLDDVRVILDKALDLPVFEKVLVIVVDRLYANHIIEVLMSDIISCPRLIPGVAFDLDPGQAGIFDCRAKRRDIVYPVSQRPVRPSRFA